MTTFVSLVSFAAGGALIWFAKDKIQAFILGSKALATNLEAKAAALKAAL
jgi:hypothetical protein